MRSSKKHNKLYNYLVNTLGISKQMVQDHIDMRLVQIDQKIDQYLKDKLESDKMEKAIMDRVTNLVKNGFEKHVWWADRDKFEQVVKEKIKQVINENFEIEVKLAKKEDKSLKKLLDKLLKPKIRAPHIPTKVVKDKTKYTRKKKHKKKMKTIEYYTFDELRKLGCPNELLIQYVLCTKEEINKILNKKKADIASAS